MQDKIPSLQEVEKKTLEHALKESKGNIQKTSKALGISRTTFYNSCGADNINLRRSIRKWDKYKRKSISKVTYLF